MAALLYQGWLIRRRPNAWLKRSIKVVLALSVLLNFAVIASWTFLALRYR